MDVPWLNEQEKVVWRLYLAATRLVDEALDRQLRADAHIPHSYYEILVRLSSVEGHALRMNELARRTMSSRSRLSHAVGKLEAMGWVRREAAVNDGRGQRAVLTEEGMAFLRDAAPGHVREVRQLVFDVLAEDQVAALEQIMRTVLKGMEADPDQIAAQPD